MLFRGIEIFNFGRYRGRHTLDAAVTADRNVILVKAKNDRGKTTLFRAIKFAMYGDGGLKPKSANEWINFQAAAQGDGEMYVEIKFEHEGSDYRLKRLVKFRKTERGKEIATEGNPGIDLFRDDNPYMAGDSDSNKKNWIDTILPLDASQFFFFDGEEIQRYIQHEEAHVKQAIEKVLGIKELLNARDDLGTVMQGLQDEYDRNIRKHAKDQKTQDAMDRTMAKLKEVGADIDGERKYLRGAESEKDRLDKEQKKFEAVRGIVQQRDDAEEKLRSLKQSRKESKKDLASRRGDTAIILLSPLLDAINKTEEDPPTVDRWQSDAAKYIVENLGECVCGRPLDQHAKDALRSKMLEVKPSKTSMLKKYATRMLLDHNPAARWVGLQKGLENAAQIEQDIDRHQSTLESLSGQIRDNEGSESLKELQAKYDEVVKDIARCENKLESLEREQSKLESEKKSTEAKINSSVVDEQLTLSESRKDMCERLIRCVDQSIERFYDTRKPALEEHVSNIFSRLTNNPGLYRGLKIGRDFSIKVAHKDDTELPTYKYSPSAGASQIVATSMIGGLNKFATRDAPVVIDTPMGRLDPVHRKNLINYYSRMGKQIIILYQPSELDREEIQSIHDSIASEWEIDSKPDEPGISYLRREGNYV